MTQADQDLFDAVDKLLGQSAKPGPGGPKTEAGKQRTHLNAYKHGLTGQIHIFTPEEHEAFDKHCQSIVQDLAPVGPMERQLAQSIAEGHWRLNRAHAMEVTFFAYSEVNFKPAIVDQPELNHPFSQGKAWIVYGKQLQLLTLYAPAHPALH